MIPLIFSSIFLWHVGIILSKSIDVNTTETTLQKSIEINFNATEVFNSTDVNATGTRELELQIDALEKQKDDLLNKINVAIDESMKALENVNDSDSVDGRQYLMELKNQIKELDEADSDEESEERNSTTLENFNEINVTSSENDNEINGTGPDFRRFGKRKRKKEVHDPKNYLIERINFKKRNKKKTAFMQSMQHQKVERDIRDWIHMKNEEKRKIREYRMKRKQSDFYYERCPREGEKKKKKNKSRNRRKKKNKGGYVPQNRFRPCCRKCCKRSYLGCL